MGRALSVTMLTLLAVGCSEADYVLRLEPVVPLNQEELLVDGQILRLQVVSDGVEPEWVTGGRLGGELTLGGVGALQDAWLGVTVEADEGAIGDFDPTRLSAFGEVGPFDVVTQSDELVASVLMASSDGVGNLGTLVDPVALAAAAITSSGDVYLFGGTPDVGGDEGVSSILKLTSLDGGDWSFTEVGTLSVGMVGARANLVEVDGRELILLTGGQAAYDEDYGPYFNQASLYDPATGEMTWTGELDFHHADHLALTLPNGRVLLGSADLEVPDTPSINAELEIFNPTTHTSEGVTGGVSVGGWGLAATVVDDKTAMLCGGGRLDQDEVSQSSASDGCDLIDTRGRIEEGPRLPEGVQMHAMATLNDGRVLLTGGVQGPMAFGPDTPAVASAWLWDPASPDTWTVLDDMNAARALHHMVTRHDGKVWVIGGTEEAALEGTSYDDNPRCPEIFDPDTLKFSLASVCHGSAVGAAPSVAVHPNQGVIVLEGIKESGEGGLRLGYLPLGPRR